MPAGSDVGPSWWSGLSRMMRGQTPGQHGVAQTGAGVKGLYMYGGVGCGKTMLMDLFVDTCPSNFKVALLQCMLHAFVIVSER
jgi:predicted ATPase